MLFVTGIIITSLLLLWLIEKTNPVVALGLIPVRLRALELLVSLFVSALVCAGNILILTFFSESNWKVNQGFSVREFFTASGWMLRSVLLEELLFRGALLYILINRIGIHKACILSSVAFGIYHWFSYSVWGNPVQMIYTFILTGVGGFMFAYAFARTKSIYLPVGLHLGWNICNVILFSNGPLGKQFLVADKGEQINTIQLLISYLYQISVLPLMVWLYLRKYRNDTSIISLPQ